MEGPQQILTQVLTLKFETIYGFTIIQQPESGLSTDQSESSDVMITAKKSTDSSTRPPTPPKSTAE